MKTNKEKFNDLSKKIISIFQGSASYQEKTRQAKEGMKEMVAVYLQEINLSRATMSSLERFGLFVRSQGSCDADEAHAAMQLNKNLQAADNFLDLKRALQKALNIPSIEPFKAMLHEILYAIYPTLEKKVSEKAKMKYMIAPEGDHDEDLIFLEMLEEISQAPEELATFRTVKHAWSASEE